MPKPIKPQHKQYILWLAAIGGAVVFLALCGFLFLQKGKNQIRQNVAYTLEMVKATCQKYDDYQLGATIKDLYAIINKTNVLSLYSDTEVLMDEKALEKYAQVQYLTGILVFDGILRQESSVENDTSVSTALWKAIREDGQVRQILDYPQKVVADKLEVDGRTYDYAIVTRRDAPGVIVCYSDTTRYQDDKYELSLNNMLEMDMTENDGVLVVTDGEKVISSSAESLRGLAVADCPITNVVDSDRMQEDSTLIQLKRDGMVWYGMHDMYRDYYLYVFYRANNIYTEIYLELVLAAAFYVVTCMVIFTVAQHRRKEKLLQVEKEYHLINAIASIYSVNLVIHLDTNTSQPITQTEAAARATAGAETAQDMLRSIARTFISRPEREEFYKFADLSTLPERLERKSFVGYSFEGQNGCWYQMFLVPQSHDRNGENLTTVMLLVRNVTDQKKRELTYQERLRDMAEQAANANAAKTDFLRRMSHDLRTPINGIRGMAEIGMGTGDNEQQKKDCFEKIFSATDYLLALVNNVLSMSKLEAEEVETENESFDLRDVLQSAESIIATQAKAAGIQFDCDAPVGEHWHLVGSPLNVQRIFQNIMDNAVKYNRPGGSVQISCRENDFDGEKATFVFVCMDTGIGMSPEFQMRAFDTFSQEHKTARTTYSGSGLGLPIAKKTVELLGGNIGFVSREGKGSVFSVTLPLKVDTEYREEEIPEEKPERIDGIRILMAEDNELNREIATYMFTEKGATVTEAEDGKQAVELFANSRPGDFDVILMDIMMPVMNGLDAAKAIRAMEREDAATIPIIAVSANSFSDDVAASKASGMNEHLSKPIDFGEVAAMIHKYIRKET